MSLAYSIETITPALAAAYLATSGINRMVRPRQVNEYADRLRRGLWILNGEALKFNHHGTLIDGQHRLLACIEANVNFETVVFRDLKEESQDTLDSGLKRTLADYLRLRNVANPMVCASAIRWLWTLASVAPGIVPVAVAPTGRDAEKILRDYPVVRSVEMVGAWRALRTEAQRGHAGLFSALHCLLGIEHGVEIANEFFEPAVSGLKVQEDSAMWLLRRKMAGTLRLTEVELAAATIKAFESHRRGTRLRQLKWKHGGKESFPSWRAED